MPEINESRYMVNAGWDDVPHLEEDTKKDLLRSTMPYLRKARSQGIPSIGSGAIYPFEDEAITCKPFPIPNWWPRSFAFDVGWNRTAALWSAWDPADQTRYVYAEYYRGKELPLIHATAIKARGDWIRGVVDPASRGRSQRDGQKLYDEYVKLGLKLELADNAVHGDDGGIYAVWSALGIGRTKIFSTLRETMAELRIYRRDEKGRIVKKKDHLMDCLRYGEKSGREVARVVPPRLINGGAQATGPADQEAGY